MVQKGCRNTRPFIEPCSVVSSVIGPVDEGRAFSDQFSISNMGGTIEQFLILNVIALKFVSC